MTQTIYKDIGIGDETTWGSSIAADSTRLHIDTITLSHDPQKEPVEDTTTSIKGRDRIVRTSNVNEGDITGYVTPRTMHHMFQMAMGTLGTTTTVGNSAIQYTYNQNTDGTMVSKTINVDRNKSQETWNGVRASAIELTGSDNKLEFTTTVSAKTFSNNGTSMQDLVGETIKTATFADVTVTIHQGASYGADITTLPVSDWSVKYNNGLEGSYLSGSRDQARSDRKIPTVEGSFTIFHEGSSFVNLQTGCSDAYIRFDVVWPTCSGGLPGASIGGGATPYTMRIDVPKTEITTNIRNYKSAEYAIEEVSFMGKFDTGTSALIIPSQTLGYNIS